MTTDTLNRACWLCSEIDRLTYLLRQIDSDKSFVDISFGCQTGVLTEEDINTVKVNLTELIRNRATLRMNKLKNEFDNL